MNNSLVEKAVSVARLMELSTAIGASAEVRDSGEVFLTTSADEHANKIGRSINEAVLYLEKVNTRTVRGTVDAVSA